MNKKLKDDLSKIHTYHINELYNNKGNKKDINFEKIIKIDLCSQSKK